MMVWMKSHKRQRLLNLEDVLSELSKGAQREYIYKIQGTHKLGCVQKLINKFFLAVLFVEPTFSVLW